MVRSLAGALAAVGGIALVGVAAVPSQGATFQNGCSTGGLNGHARFDYTYSGNTVFTSGYQYGIGPALQPTDPGYGNNNVNINWTNNGVDAGAYQSPDTLHRDGQWHNFNPGVGSGHNGLANLYQVKYTVIFNTSAQPDPRCSITKTV